MNNRPACPRVPAALAARALAELERRRAQAQADRKRLDELMAEACAMRARGEISQQQLDQAAAVFARAALAIAGAGATA